MIPSRFEITRGATLDNGWTGVRVECLLCGALVYTAVRGERLHGITETLREHGKQHEPGRAPNIEVSWEVDASCSVCDDGGDITDSGDGLECLDCGTTWELDGTLGTTMREG